MARLLLADEDRLFRSALSVVLTDEQHTVVHEVESAAPLAPELFHDIDLVLASSTLAASGRLLSAAPGGARPRLVVLSLVTDHDRLVEALGVGAQGYLGKDVGLRQLLDAVQAVLRGEAYVPPAMLGGLLHELVQRRRTVEAPTRTSLSRREQEVLELLAQGQDQTTIAKALVISPQTARTHIQKVMSKLGAHSRSEAVALAVRDGLVAAS